MEHFIAGVAAWTDQISPPPATLLSHAEKYWPAARSSTDGLHWVVGTEQNRLPPRSNGGARRKWAAGAADLHNRAEIDSELKKNGHRPCSTDLERIVVGHEAFGDNWFCKLRGPFAFILCGAGGDVVAARDQIGIRPLYYLVGSGVVYVSTDLRALTELDAFDWSLDPCGLTHAVSGLWGDPEATAWRQIRRLPAGHLARAAKNKMHLNDYWAPTQRITLQGGKYFGDYAGETEALLWQAVDRSLGPGRTALELSGGFDSSTVAGFVARNRRQGTERPLALTWDLSDPRSNDRPFARAVADMHQLDWRLVPAGASKSGAVDRAIRWCDLPGNYLLDEIERAQKMARRSGAVRYLTGQLGDLVFVGESWAALMQFIIELHPLYVLKHSHWGRKLAPNLLELVRRHPAYARAGDRFRPLRGYTFLDPELRAATGLNKRRVKTNPFDRDAALISRARSIRTPQAQRIMELMHRVGVETGLSVGHPLVDVDLVEFILSVPPAYFVGQPGNRRLHAAAAGSVLPRAVATRSDKADFSWSALDAVASQDPDTLIDQSVLADKGWIDRDKARRVLHRVRENEVRGQSLGWEVWEIIGLVETEVFLQNVLLKQ